MIDLHCHIDLYPNPDSVLKRADDAGVYTLSVTTTPKAWCGTNNMGKKYKRVRTALGLHPQLAHERYGELSLFEKLLPEVQYVGEIGLDKSKHYKKFYEKQHYVFCEIIKMLNSCGGKIMSIHSLYAVDEVLTILENNPKSGPAILHWFTGNESQLKKAIDIGCWFSIGPKMIGSAKGKKLIPQMPLDRILLETDGPFTQKNNKNPFEPSDTILMADNLSKLLNIQKSDMKKIILNNFKSLTSFNS